jgi:hypothetical protein
LDASTALRLARISLLPATNDKGSLMTYTEYMIQTSWAGRVKVVEKRFRDIDALVCKIRFLLPNSVRCRLKS